MSFEKARLSPQALAFLFVGIAAVGVTYFYRSFAKIEIGPFYILEILFLVAFVFICMSALRPSWGQLKFLVWFILFFIWGVVLLAFDLISHFNQLTDLPYPRILQHGIIFVYPLMWTLAGFWMGTSNTILTKRMVFIIFGCALMPNLWGENVTNISIGPLLAVPFSMILHRILKQPLLFGTRNKSLGVILVLGFFTCWPFWWMWMHSMQRTSLLLLFFFFLLVPFFLEKFTNLFVVFRTFAVSVLILVTGWGAVSTYKAIEKIALYYNVKISYNSEDPQADSENSQLDSEDMKTYQISKGLPDEPLRAAPVIIGRIFKVVKRSIKNSFYRSMQKGEDIPVPDNPMPFQGRFRKFCWKTALSDWSHSPVFGLGFIPEVPSSIEPGKKNDGGFERNGTPPVSGPHNSYLSILARMGVVGFLIFGGVVWFWCVQACLIIQKSGLGLYELLLILVPIAGGLHALFNIGIESPHNSLIMWLFTGISLAYAYRLKVTSKNNPAVN